MPIPKIKIVVATRAISEDFEKATALGNSLSIYRMFSFIHVRLFADNRLGLPTLYNQVIDESIDDPALLVFVHDDVYLCDFYWASNLIKGLEYFSIIGLAGNKRRLPGQPSWLFIDEKYTRDDRKNLSGLVGHGKGFPNCRLSVYGRTGEEVKLLDGLFMACYSQTLIQHQLRFDERFDFHFYDMDFCRQAEAKGLRMGTWPISVIHESGGIYTDAWHQSCSKYLAKWKDIDQLDN